MKAKVHIETSKSKVGDIIEVLAFQNDLDYIYAICKSSNGELEIITIGNLQIIDEPNQLSKDMQAQLILFEGQCKMNAMLACNMQRKACNESMAYIDCDFIDLQEEIECRINELNNKSR